MADKKNKRIEEMTKKELTKLMAGPSRIKRKEAANYLAELVKENPAEFKQFIPDFIDALARPEAQTRRKALDSLSNFVSVDVNACKQAIDGAEEALFDPATELLRESAMRFLCRYGATSKVRSKEVWPIIKEALQMYHGEIEFDKLLNRVHWFATGNLNDDVKKDFRATIREISNSVGGPTKSRLDKILATLKSRAKNKQAALLNPVQKPVPKKTTAKKATAKKPAAKKTPTKKTNSKKATAKKPVAKKTTAKKATAKKPATKNISKQVKKAKKTVAKKAVKKVVKKAVSKKLSPKKKKTTVSKAKKPATKKPATKKPATKKPATKKPVAKKTTTKKPVKKAANKKK